MIDFYYNAAPNPRKVALLLEELREPYRPIAVDTRKGDQHRPEFLAINPNAKVPAIVDDGVRVFDSNAILLYLAEKSGRFLSDLAARGELYSWLMFIASGIGPYSGQSVHFRNYAAEKIPYALNRYLFEAKRHWAIVDRQLGTRRYLCGNTYTIADMALWGWGRSATNPIGEDAYAELTNLHRFMDEINERPAAQRAMELCDTAKFKAGLDEESQRALFPSNFVDAQAAKLN